MRTHVTDQMIDPVIEGTRHLYAVLVLRGPGSLDTPDAVARAILVGESTSDSASMHRERLGAWLTRWVA